MPARFSTVAGEQGAADIAAAMGGAPQEIIDRQLALFAQIHPDYADGVRRALQG